MRFYKRLNLIMVFLLYAITNIVFANKKETEEIDESKPFYSEYKESVNVNNGVKVTIAKSDKYGDFQDEYVAVDVSVENLNRYANLDFSIEALTGDEFTVKNNNKKLSISTNDSKDFSFDYKYGKSKRPYKGKIEDLKLDRDIAFGDKYEHSTRSNAYERYYRDIATESYIKIEDKAEKNPANNFIYIFAIVIIAGIFLLVILYLIKRYINSRDEFYSLFIIMTVSMAMVLSVIFNNNNTYAYTQQTFLTNTEYTNTYTATVWHGGKDYTFRFMIRYKFVGEMPTFDVNEDSDNDGLTNNYEVYFMTDMYNADTDGDGINDFDEIYVINTNPLSINTENDRMNDGDRDYDRDGLTNIEEKHLNTFMDNTDTDSDGLTDYEEVKKYGTDPLKEDTDGDGLSDYEEVEVAKKLNITDISSIDKNITYEQELSRDNFDGKLYMDNVIKMSVSGDVSGLIDNHIKVKDRTNATLENVGSILGRVAYIDNNYESTNINVIYDISNYSLKGEALKICTYEDGKVKMLDTTLNDNKISASINSGFVFVVDVTRYVDDILAYKKDNLK